MRTIVGDLAVGVAAGVLFVVWLVLAVVVASLARFVGVGVQVALGALSVCFFLAFWALGLWYLFGDRSGDAEQVA